MSSPTQGIYNDILLPLDVMNIKIILTQELHLATLSCIHVWLSKDVLQATMIAMQFKLVSQKEMSPAHKCMHHGYKF